MRQASVRYSGAPGARTHQGMTNTMRRIRAIRTTVNVGAAVLLLFATTAAAAQIAGVPDPTVFGEGDEAVGILTAMTVAGIAAVVFGTPVVLAVNLLYWAAGRWFARHGAGGPDGVQPASKSVPEGSAHI